MHEDARAHRSLHVLGLTAAIGLAAAALASAQTAPSHATVSLVSEESALKPGAASWVGVLFDLEPGWHIYWVNPGDAGDPPRLRWELPPGFRANDIQWPVPVRLVLGPIIDYGYEGRVLLALPIDVPASYKAGTPVTLATEVRYVICREVCIPARTKVSVSMPTADATAPTPAARRELFTTARARWPKPVPASWKVAATNSGSDLTVTLRTGSSESKATFFPLDIDQIDNAAPQAAKATPDGVQLTLRRADPDAPPPAAVKGVVVLSGDGRAYQIDVAIDR
jgi:DsbC/DsbD-like thiol-disulfide interchange protein